MQPAKEGEASEGNMVMSGLRKISRGGPHLPGLWSHDDLGDRARDLNRMNKD